MALPYMKVRKPFLILKSTGINIGDSESHTWYWGRGVQADFGFVLLEEGRLLMYPNNENYDYELLVPLCDVSLAMSDEDPC